MSCVRDYSLRIFQAQALSTAAPELVAEMSANIADSLATITEQVDDTSALPLDLGTTVDILGSVIRYSYNQLSKTMIFHVKVFIDLALQTVVGLLNKKSLLMYVYN